MLQKIKNIYHLCNAFVANVWYGFPSKKLTVIGVTGTDGKTTTTSLIYHILKTAGKDVSMISTVGAIINGKKYDVGFHVTTPSPWQIQRFLNKAKGYLVLEVTSHSLDQYRVWGIDFSVGVLTNVTNEHLDYHKTYENYVGTKTKLLKRSNVVIYNRDDKSYSIISNLKTQNSLLRQGYAGQAKQQLKTQKFITYGLKQGDVTPKIFTFKTNLFGEYNKYNILAAVAACQAVGISDSIIRKGIDTFTLPVGRAEIVYPSAGHGSSNEGSGQADFTVMIDFAHTPNAFAKLLPEVKKQTKGRLIHVFGSAGLRDAAKRPEMGKISSQYADIIVLTAEDPRSESVEKIMNEIQAGIFNFQFSIFNQNKNFQFQNDKKYLFKIPNRQEAITEAIKMAKKGDFVLLTGKSHEQSMNYGNGEEPWSEHEAVSIAIKSKMGALVAHENFLVAHAKGLSSKKRSVVPANSHNENFVGSPRLKKI